MKIVILRKSNQLGSTAKIYVKGMSANRYNFVWDRSIGNYAYEPKDQREVDDIFNTQGKLYRHMFFGVVMDTPEPEKKLVKEGMIKQSLAEAEVETTKPKAKAKGRKSKAKQPVEKAILEA